MKPLNNAPSRAHEPTLRDWILLAIIAVLVGYLCCNDPAHAAETTRLTGPVDAAMSAKAEAAIARGDRMVEIASPGGAMALGFGIGERFKAAGVAVRCVGVCASAAAQILIASKGCIVARSGRVILHRPVLTMANLDSTTFAKLDHAVLEAWRAKMESIGVPDDLIFRTEQAFGGVLELNDLAMRRVGCEVE